MSLNPPGKGSDAGLRVLIAGGGTGGHLFPGIAIAETFVQDARQTRVMFVSSGRAIEETVLANTPYEKKRIAVEGIKGKSLFSKLAALMRVPGGLIQAFHLLGEFAPHVVIGMGAYSAGPVVVAAWMRGIHRVICEQNSFPGLTSRLLAGFAERIYVSFPDSGFKEVYQSKIRFTGNPVRQAIAGAGTKKEGGEKAAGEAAPAFTVLILGGSQGAHSINMAVLDCVMHLTHPEKFRFVHQTGPRDMEEVRKIYLQMHMDATVAAFFENMGALYEAADLVICRSGATTVAELTVAGKAVIFIPFPQAADNHQVANAKALVADGAAEMIEEADLSGEMLSRRIVYYSENGDARQAMEVKMRRFGHPDAARRIVDDIYGLLGISNTRLKNTAGL